MSAVFVTCALSHLMAVLLTAADPRGVVFDNLGVPASIYFHVGGPPPAPRFRA